MPLTRRSILTALGASTAAALPLKAWSVLKEKGVVGVSMPTFTSQRWVVEGLAMTRAFSQLDYRPILQFAEDDIPKQIAQLDAMLDQGADALVIGAIDGTKLTDVLRKAAAKKVKVISYDRLIRGSSDVDFYTSFDNYKVGVLQGTDIANRLNLATAKGPFFIELVGGSPDDNNAFFFYNGAMSVLQPHIDKGTLVVGSGQVGMTKVSTLRWSGTVARARMAKILEVTYKKQRVDAILSPYDGISLELVDLLKKSGYAQALPGLPIVTGQDAELPSVRSVIHGQQASTVFKDTRELAKATVVMVDSILSKRPVAINDNKTYNNGEKVVPAMLLQPVLVDGKNWHAALVDTGYYHDNQLQVSS